MTTPASAFPRPLADLLPEARQLADSLGDTPSINQLVKHLRIGRTKARALADAITGITPTPVPEPVEPTAPAVEIPTPVEPVTVALPQATVNAEPLSNIAAAAPVARRIASWPVFLIALPAFVAIWSGWVGLGSLTGFGVVHPLPGIWDSFSINTAVTLPIGVEVYAAYALRAWLAGSALPVAARRFAKWSAICSLVVGSAGQVAYHLMEARGITSAPWPITTAVACLPVAVLGMGAALAHLLNRHDTDADA